MRVPLGDLIFALSKALDCVEQQLLGVTTNHGKRVALLSMRLCRAMGMPETDVFDMATCAVLHDCALTAYMREAGPGSGFSRLELFKNHCPKGEDIARAFPFQGDVTGVILHHHENVDGTGYYGLKGNAIPLRAAVLRLADNMDLHLAMGEYSAALPGQMAQHARDGKGTLYAPQVVDALLDMLKPEGGKAGTLLTADVKEGLDQHREYAPVFDLANERIDAALEAELPALRVDLSTRDLLSLCSVFAAIIDAKSAFTHTHSSGLAAKVRHMGECYGFGLEHLDKLTVAAYLHDVGKLSTPVEILEKAGPLTHDEYEIMKDHVAMTWRILENVRGLEDIVRWGGCHHEKLDGSGYPHGYSAEALSLECRLMVCCDIYQALTEDRPYREGMGHDAAMAIVRSMADEGKLDTDIVGRMQRYLRPDLLSWQ